MRIRVVSTLVACGLLVGCSSGPGSDPAATPGPTAQEVPATADTPQAFHFESGTLEIGEFDPWTLGDDIFDPCTEISAEEFAAAGFGRVEQLPDELKGLGQGLSICDVLDSDQSISSDFSNNRLNQAMVSEKARVSETYGSTLLPVIFTFRLETSSENDCYAQIDTRRGGLTSGVTLINPDMTDRSPCEIAIQNIENLYRAASPD